MRIECDKCAAKYSIADEKVRGRTFKIRCKKCSNVIIVRDKAAGGDAAASSDGPDEDESEPAGWHLAIDGETVGPLSEAEVRQRFDAGQIDRSTSTWQEGFDDWVELGSIEMFADLPDRPSGRAAAVVAAAPARSDDPFASSGDDAFAASSGEYGGHSSQPVAAAVESPRVSAASLTGQRNENSVLFSLDSLKSVATARPSSAGPVRQAPSTTAPSSEGSGLIDIRAMGAMLGGSAGPSLGGGGGGDDEVLPSFGGGGLGGLSVEPLVTEAPVIAAVAPPPPQRSNAPMYILIGLLLVGLVGLGAYIFLKPPDAPQVIEKTVEVPGKVEEKDDDKGDKDDGKDDEKDDGKDDEKDDGKDETSGGETDGAAAAEGGEAGVAGTGTKKAGTGTKKVGDSKTTDTKTTDTKTTDTKKTDTKKEPDVDCLLNPGLAKCKGGGGGDGGSDTKPAVDGSLPKKLGTTEISKGIAAVKASAKACGPKNGAAAGTKVAIKFSVTGSTGAVSSATATGEHAGSALGKCVEAESKKASFPKFQDAQQGFQFSFTM